jgi:NAD(P)-dependent dehydrogenase (short-subunit alcohol dehydrogenase family)
MLKDKVAIITGSGSGIGKSTVNLFLQEGAKLGLIDIDHEWILSLSMQALMGGSLRLRI